MGAALAACVLALLWTTLAPVARAGGGGKGGSVKDSGTVAARALLRGPGGYPIYAEFDEDGSVHRSIGEADGELRDSQIMSADRYRALVEQAENFREDNETGSARGATYMTAAEYRSRVFFTLDGQTVQKPSLPASVQSVLVRGPDTLRSPQTNPVLLTSVIDLVDRKDLQESTKSLLLTSDGKVHRESEYNIGYRTGFYKPDDASYDVLEDTSRDDPLFVRQPGDTPHAPVPNVGVEVYIDPGASAVTQESGRYTIEYRVPTCPGAVETYDFPIAVNIPYQTFNPKSGSGSSAKPVSTHYTVTKPNFYVCQDLFDTASSSSTVSSVGSSFDFKIDVVLLSGRGVFTNQQGGAPIPLAADGQPTRYGEDGLLAEISQEDLEDTDLYVFRESNGQLIASREGLKPDEIQPPFTGTGTIDEQASLFYRMLIRGPRAGSDRGIDATGSFEEYQTQAGLEPAFQKRQADHLRPGEKVRLVVINRPTGYMATSTTLAGNIAETGQVTAGQPSPGVLNSGLETLELRPPNLKIAAVRTVEVEDGLAEGDEKQIQIGYEGSGLTSDRVIEVTTDWRDHDESPLPAGLKDHGFTGRLAKLIAQGVLAPAGNDVANFAIEPGRHTQIARLSEEVTGREHLYLQVNGQPTDRNPDFSSKPAAGGAARVANRPKHYVPVQVPVFNEAKTLAQELAVAQSLIAGYQEGADPPVLEDPEPQYDWVTRPEYQLTLYDFAPGEIVIETDAENASGSSATQVEFDYELVGPSEGGSLLDPLPRFQSPERQLAFLLNALPALASIAALSSQDQQAILTALEAAFAASPAVQIQIVEDILSKLQPEDFVTLSLVQVGDLANPLYEAAGLPLLLVPSFRLDQDGQVKPIELVRTVHLAAYDAGIAGSAGADEITDSFQKVDFILTQESDVVVKLLDPARNEVTELVSEESLPPGAWSFVVTVDQVLDAGLGATAGTDFYVQLEATSTSGANPIVHRATHPGVLDFHTSSRYLGTVVQHDVLIQRGALSVQRQDLVLTGRGPQLSFTRSYSNQGRFEESGVLGQGWSHNHDIRLSISAYGMDEVEYNLPSWVASRRGELFRPDEVSPSSDAKQPRLITVSNGGQFKRVNGIWYPQRSYHGTLVETAAGFEYRSKDGTLYFFGRPLRPADPTEESGGSSQALYLSLGDTLYNRLGIPLEALRLAGDPSPDPTQPQPLPGEEPVQYIEDPDGNRLTYTYGPGPRGPLVTRIEDATGRALTFEYGTDARQARLQRVLGPDGTELGFEYDATPTGGLLLKEFRRDEYVESYGYRPEVQRPGHNLETVTDSNGHRTVYGYKPLGALSPQTLGLLKAQNPEDIVASVTYAEGSGDVATALFDYVPDGTTNERVVIDARGNATTYLLNATGNPLEMREPEGQTTFMTWSIDEGLPDNVMTSKTSSHTGLTTTYVYDAKGNVIEETDSVTGQTTYRTWNQQYSLVESEIDKNGNERTWSYDANGNLITETIVGADVSGVPTTITQTHEYNGLGQRTATVNWRGHRTEFDYDAYGSLEEIREPEGSVTRYVNDARGRRLETIDPNGNRRTNEYDDLDRVIRETDPLGNTVEKTYDAKGNVLTETRTQSYTANGQTFNTTLTLEYQYDERDRVTQITRTGSGPGAIIGGNRKFTYDDNSNLLSETDWRSERAEVHTYDALNRRLITRNRNYALDQSEMVYTYTFVPGTGTVTTMQDYEGRITTTTTDPLGRKVLELLPPVSQRDPSGAVTGQIQYERSWTYDNLENVLTETDAEGRTTTYQYDARYNRTRRTNALTPTAGVYVWQYDANGNVVKEIDEEGRETSSVYDQQNRRTDLNAPEGHNTHFTYDANGNVTQQEDPWGFVTTMQYDALDHAVLVTDPDGSTELAYTPEGKETYRRTAEGQITTQLYDALGRLVEETDPRGRKLYHAYDLDDNEIFTLRTWPGHGGGPAQVRTRRQYDPLNRVEFELQADGAQGTTPLPILYTYDKVGNLLIEERPDGRTTTTTYDELNRPVVVTDALTQSTVVRYDGVGNERFRTDRRGNTWEMQYDALNRKILDRSPTLSATGFPIETEYTYDAVGNLRFQSNPRLPGVADARTETTYDDLNRPLDTFKRAVLANPPIRLIHNEYDTSGLKTGTRQDAITDANGNRVVYDKNFRGQEIRKEYPPDANSVVVTETQVYDKVGNLIQSQDGDGLITQIAYFPDNTQASMTNAELETTRYEYDLNGNRIQETRPKGDTYTTTYLYDERSRLVRVTNPEGGVTRYEYDANSNLRHQYTPPANDQGIESHVEYVYDALNRRTSHIQHKASGNLTTTFGYDPEGNLTSHLDPKGQTFTYDYDEVNRRTLETYPATPSAYLQIQTIETEYDNNNNVTVVTETKSGALDGSGTGGTVIDVCDMTYDLFDRLLTRTQRGKLVTYTYDDNGNRTSVTSSGGTTVYTFDHRNRLSTARLNVDGPTTYTYRNNSWLALVEYPNGTEVATTYDNAGRIDTVTNRKTAGALISSFHYEYDDNGNRTLQLEEQTGFADGQIQNTTYTYDRTDRLTGYDIETLDSGDVQSTTYTYYPSYDRRTEQVVLTTLSGSTSHKDRVYRYDETHWLTEIQNSSDGLKISYAYDNNGNQIEKLDSTQETTEQTQFVYDSRNQLTQATRGPPGSETDQGRYDYDYMGMRVRHLGSERGDIEYVYDDRAIIDEFTGAGIGSGAQLAHYNYADRLVSLHRPADTQYYHFAALRTTANLSDDGGVIKVAYRTDPFGAITREEGSSVNRQVFTGQEHDEQTGLIYFGARYYDPDAARFINQDPYLGEPGIPPSLHRYLYAYSNPTVYVDLYGYDNSRSLGRQLLDENLDVGATLGGAVVEAAGGSRQAGSFFGSLGLSVIPGVGELGDVGTIFSLDHKVGTGQRLVATASLALSVLTLGTSPNFGGVADELGEAGVDLVTAAGKAETPSPSNVTPTAAPHPSGAAGAAPNRSPGGGSHGPEGPSLTRENPSGRGTGTNGSDGGGSGSGGGGSGGARDPQGPFHGLTDAEIDAAVDVPGQSRLMIEAPAPQSGRSLVDEGVPGGMQVDELRFQSESGLPGANGDVTTTMRAHTPDPSAPRGSNSATGNTVTITQSKQKRYAVPDQSQETGVRWMQTRDMTDADMNDAHIPLFDD